MNHQASSIPPVRHGNRGRSNQHHNMPFQHRAHQPSIYHQGGSNYNPMRPQQQNQHRVLIANTPAIGAYMAPRPGLAGNMIQSVGRQPLYPQPQVVPPQPFPHQFSHFLSGQGTQMPINLMQNPGTATAAPIMTPQMGQLQPQPQLQAAQPQAPMLRPGHNTMMVFTPEQQQQQQQHIQQQQPAGVPQAGKKRSSAIKIIDPNTNAEVNVNSKNDAPILADKTNLGENSDVQVKEDFKKKVAAVSNHTYQAPQVPDPESGVVPAATTEEPYHLPNAIITKPPIETSKPKAFPPILDGPSENQVSGALETSGDSAGTAKEALLPKPEIVNLIAKVSSEVDVTTVDTTPVVTSASQDNNRSEDAVISEANSDRSEIAGGVLPGDASAKPAAAAELMDSTNRVDVVEDSKVQDGVASEKPKEESVVEVKSEASTDDSQLSQKASSSSGSSSAASSSSQIGVSAEPTTEAAEVELKSTSATSIPTVEPMSETSGESTAEMPQNSDTTGDLWSTTSAEEKPEVEKTPVEPVIKDNAPSVTTPLVGSTDDQEQNLKNIMNGNGNIEDGPLVEPEPVKEVEVYSRIEPESLIPPMIDGKMRYERDFMLRFKNLPVCKEIPADLKKSYIFSVDGHHMPPSGGGGMGHYHQGGGGRGGPDKNRGRRQEPKKIVIPQPMDKKVVLHKAAKPWMAQKKDKEGADPAESQTQELYRKFQGILNKLTPQKFQALAEQALKLEINTEERLSGCIDKIFTKALEEPSFSIAYANLCKVMSPIKVEYTSEEGKTKQTNFRRMLLTKCQREFEKDKKDDESLETMQKDIENAESEEKRAALKVEMEMTMTRMRKRSLGNIRFIGELFKLQMLSEVIMHECITRLLKSTSDEESLECFARLVTTTGKELDREAAKGRIDTYFKRINDIIKKGKVPSRVRFMLQDVIELRKNCWVPRVRQDQQLKTIDQIHAEAAIEQAKEKEMVQQHHVISKGGGGGGRDNRRGSKDDHMMKERDHRREREKFEPSKLNKLMSTRKDKGSSGQGQLAPSGFLRPAAGWKKTGTQPSDGAKSKILPRSSTGPGSKSKTDNRAGSRAPTIAGPRRSHTTPESEKESLLQAVNKFTTSEAPEASAPTSQPPHRDMPSRDAPAQAILCSEKRPSLPVPMSKENILAVQRKIVSTIDELVNNKDYKEAIECVKEIDLPGAMKQVVVEGINHTLERKAVYRPVTGELFSRLIQEKVVSQHDFSDGLSEVLEVAEDMAIDIPKIWDYLGEVLCPVFAHEHVPLSAFKKSPPSLLESGRVSGLVAKLLSQCQSVLKGEEEVKGLWNKSGLQWEDLGVQKEDLEEFLDRRDLIFLLVKKSPRDLPQSLLESLHSMLVATDSTTDDVNNWIKKNCAGQGYDPALLVTNLTSAVVQASVSGTGDHAIFSNDLFERRIEVVKTQGHYGVAVLHGLQCSVAKLSHPPKLLHDLFNSVYDLDLVDEQEFYTWRDDDQLMYGKGTAVASVNPFFDWLKADKSSEQT